MQSTYPWQSGPLSSSPLLGVAAHLMGSTAPSELEARELKSAVPLGPFVKGLKSEFFFFLIAPFSCPSFKEDGTASVVPPSPILTSQSHEVRLD